MIIAFVMKRIIYLFVTIASLTNIVPNSLSKKLISRFYYPKGMI